MAVHKRALSLCGCGFLGVYHAGAVAGLRDHGALDALTRTGIVGASAGALVGAISRLRTPVKKRVETTLESWINRLPELTVQLPKLPSPTFKS